MTEVVFDTSVLIDHLRNVNEATALIEKVKNGSFIGYISVITEAELFAGKDVESNSKRKLLEELLNLFSSVDVSGEIARVAGSFRRRYGTNLVDCIIASTANNLHCKLITKNIKDFEPIKDVSVEEPY